MSEELIIEDWLTAEGLKTYRRNRENYLRLCDKKTRIISALSGLKSVDFEKDKVTNGSNKHISQQEILAIRLEDINKQIDVFERFFEVIRPAVLRQLIKLADYDSRKVLQLFYLDAETSSNCTMYFYGENPDLKENWETYLQKFKTLKRQALKDFDKLATVKYVKVEQKQMF